MFVTSLVTYLCIWLGVVVWCHGLTPCWLPQDGRLALHYAAARKETLPIYTALINAGKCSLEVATEFHGTKYLQKAPTKTIVGIYHY